MLNQKTRVLLWQILAKTFDIFAGQNQYADHFWEQFSGDNRQKASNFWS